MNFRNISKIFISHMYYIAKLHNILNIWRDFSCIINMMDFYILFLLDTISPVYAFSSIGTRSSIYSCYTCKRLNCKFTSCSRLYSAQYAVVEKCIIVIISAILNDSTRWVLIYALNVLRYVTFNFYDLTTNFTDSLIETSINYSTLYILN